jgi:hypothetical protein
MDGDRGGSGTDQSPSPLPSGCADNDGDAVENLDEEFDTESEPDLTADARESEADTILREQLSNKRLTMQLFLCGGVVLGSCLLLAVSKLVFNIVSFFTTKQAVGKYLSNFAYLAPTKLTDQCMDVIPTIVSTVRSLGSSVHFYLHALRISGEVLIIVGLFFAVVHRIIGLALSYYLQTSLDPDRIGQYQFNFKWISLRFGLDQNMLVISGLEWRNPPEFTDTPYLLRIDEISFIIDPWSVYGAVMHDKSIRIKEIKLDKATIHIEKLTQASIDKAAAAAKTRGAVVPLTEPAASADAPAELDTASRDDRPEQRKAKLREPLKPGMLNLWAAMGATNPQQEASVLSRISGSISSTMEGTTNMVQVLANLAGNLDVSGTLKSVTNTLERTFRRTFSSNSKPRRSSNADRSRAGTLEIIEESEDREDTEDALGDGSDSSTHQPELTMDEALAMLRDEHPDLVLPPLPEDAEDDEDRQQRAEALANAAKPKETPEERAARRKRKADAWKGFGVPYRLEIDFLLLHDLKLHAHDLLGASRSKDSNAGVIKLGTLGMMRDELTLPPNERSNGYRRGVYLDAVVWRLVNRLLSDLMRNNSLAMLMLLGSAAASQTTSAVSSAGSMASKGATSGGRLLSQAASTTAEVALSTANTAANTAVQALNATTADAARNARSALRSVGQFLKGL